MIVPMKKVAVITQSKDALYAVGKLRSLGILHVEYCKPHKGKDINAVEEDIGLIEKAVEVLDEAALQRKEKENGPKGVKDWKTTARHITDLRSRLDQIEEYSRGLKKKISDWESWGDFDPLHIQELAEKGIYVQLYQVPPKEVKKFPAGVIVKQLSTVRGLVN